MPDHGAGVDMGVGPKLHKSAQQCASTHDCAWGDPDALCDRRGGMYKGNRRMAMLLDSVNDRGANFGPRDPDDVGAGRICGPKPFVDRPQILCTHAPDFFESLLGWCVVHDASARSIGGEKNIEHFAPETGTTDYHDRSLVRIRKQRSHRSP